RTDAILRHLAAGYPEGTFMLTAPQVFSVHCSFEAVVRALRNLIDNARRHGAPADASSDTSAPLVELQVQAEGDSVAFIVLDRGPGIPESLLESMQQPFRRSDASRNRASGGAGLGLAIARAVAEAHDGSLQLANREGGGLRAVLRLPLGTFYSSR
ncbi:MAG: sensor histidine kinase, partial [Pseudomonadota bacterium]